jgi:hypothetical protein
MQVKITTESNDSYIVSQADFSILKQYVKTHNASLMQQYNAIVSNLIADKFGVDYVLGDEDYEIFNAVDKM